MAYPSSPTARYNTIPLLGKLPDIAGTYGSAGWGGRRVFFGEHVSGKIFKATPAGEVTLFVEGLGRLALEHMAFDKEGNLFVTTAPTATLKKITPDGTITTFASGFYGKHGGFGYGPYGIVLNKAGDIFVSNKNHILKIAKEEN